MIPDEKPTAGGGGRQEQRKEEREGGTTERREEGKKGKEKIKNSSPGARIMFVLITTDFS